MLLGSAASSSPLSSSHTHAHAHEEEEEQQPPHLMGSASVTECHTLIKPNKSIRKGTHGHDIIHIYTENKAFAGQGKKRHMIKDGCHFVFCSAPWFSPSLPSPHQRRPPPHTSTSSLLPLCLCCVHGHIHIHTNNTDMHLFGIERGPGQHD